MTDERTYTGTRTNNPVEFDEVDMSGSDSLVELRRAVHEVTRQQLKQTRQQLAEAMQLVAELSAELEDARLGEENVKLLIQLADARNHLWDLIYTTDVADMERKSAAAEKWLRK